MFKKLTNWLRRRRSADGDLSEAELKELADLIQNGDPTDPETVERIAYLLGQTGS
jgi:hypothetical protein